MGIDLVKLASLHGRHLSGNAHKVLVHMASTALDKPNSNGQPPNLYYRGWQSLALVLGYDVPSGEDEASRKRRRDQSSHVARAVRELKAKGLVEPLYDHPRTGLRQTYRLHLQPVQNDHPQPVQNDHPPASPKLRQQPVQNDHP